MNTKNTKHNQKSFYQACDKSSCGVAFVSHTKAKKSHTIIEEGLEALKNLAHRGATGRFEKEGDGAGIMTQLPQRFFRSCIPHLPKAGHYAVCQLFLDSLTPPKDINDTPSIKKLCSLAKKEGLSCFYIRLVPTKNSALSKRAKKNKPAIYQLFFKQKEGKILDETTLYWLKEALEAYFIQSQGADHLNHVASFSAKTIVYKALLMPQHLACFYPDLQNPRYKSAFSLVHSRFATNTLTSWALVQPCQMLAHNGELNTLQGNIDSVKTLYPLYNTKKKSPFRFNLQQTSDSMCLDQWVSFLYHNKLSLAHIFSILLAPSTAQRQWYSDEIKSFFRYHSAQLEQWGGPAALMFSDGDVLGACLDRFGLRPLRYQLFSDDHLVVGSEIGLLHQKKAPITEEGRIKPTGMLVLNFKHKKIYNNDAIKTHLAHKITFQNRIKNTLISLSDISEQVNLKKMSKKKLARYQKAFGYSKDIATYLLKPMVEELKEGVFSMGSDRSLAALKNQQPRFFNYFQQRFAQVSNPALDPIREQINLSLNTYFGKRHPITKLNKKPYPLYHYKHAILSDAAYHHIKITRKKHLKAITLPIVVDSNTQSLKGALSRLLKKAKQAINKNYTLLILSDEGITKNRYAIPSLLAISFLHQALIKENLRAQVGLIVHTGDAYESHHIAALYAYGANAIHPYVAYQSIQEGCALGFFNIDAKTGIKHYQEVMDKAILKILSKLGIPTLRGYIGSKQMDPLGLSSQVLKYCFNESHSLIEGLRFSDIQKERLVFHKEAYKNPESIFSSRYEGLFKYRKNGNFHAWNPKVIVMLQKAVRNNDKEAFQAFLKNSDQENSALGNLRGLFNLNLDYNGNKTKVSKHLVKQIIKSLSTGAMSLGSLSKEAHESLAEGMNALGSFSNSGEGGESLDRIQSKGSETDKNSRIKQVASGRFGVYSDYLFSADVLQIKIVQGAKPGEGGQIPGFKVTEDIAKIRFTKAGTELISPPPHHDIYSIEDLKQLIYDLKAINPKAKVSVKLVSETGVGTIAVGVAKAKADFITVSGFSGATGASLLSSIHHAGLPWEIGLAETHQALCANQLRDQVKLQVDGGLKTSKDVLIAAILGANMFGFSTAALVSLGCVMARECHSNTCPTGVATQDPELRKLFKGDPEHIKTWASFLAYDIAKQLTLMGYDSLDKIRGKSHLLKIKPDTKRWKTKKLDFSRFFYKNLKQQAHKPLKKEHFSLDELIFKDLISKKKKKHYSIHNTNLSFGAKLSYLAYKNTFLKKTNLKLQGYPGQSFGAFLTQPFSIHCEGACNDYVGKSLSGGEIIIYPTKQTQLGHIIVGNTCFYGATSGFAFIAGAAGERFAVRNSGATLVIEGVGDHACEYMTGGTIICLGDIGINFGAGMSGGTAYLYGSKKHIVDRLNNSAISIDTLNRNDLSFVKQHLAKHLKKTKSIKAKMLLDNWSIKKKKLVKIIPKT